MASDSQENVASASGAADIVLKFDMHIYMSVMSEQDVRNAARIYGIPSELNPRLPPSGMTMDRLSRNAIGIYEAYLEFSGIRVTVFYFPSSSS